MARDSTFETAQNDPNVRETPAGMPQGWATTRTGKTYHHFGSLYRKDEPLALCHWGLVPDPKAAMLEKMPATPGSVVCDTCRVRLKSLLRERESKPVPAPAPKPGQWAAGARVKITSGKFKHEYGTLKSREEQHVGFWWVNRNAFNGKGHKSVLISQNQLEIQPT